MEWDSPVLDRWWATCTPYEQGFISTSLSHFLAKELTPGIVLDQLSTFVQCNFAIDRLRNMIDADLREHDRMLETLTLGDIGGLL